MRGIQLYLRSRRIPLALATAAATILVVWTLWTTYSNALVINARLVSLTVMLAVTAFASTLSGADDALERTASVNWPVRRVGHLLLTGAAIAALLLLTTVTDARFAPLVLVLRNTAGLLGLTALGATLLGAGWSWIAPLTWTLVAVMPFMDVSDQVKTQLASWLIQPVGTTAATVCAGALAAAGLLAYTLRGCPLRPPAETLPDS